MSERNSSKKSKKPRNELSLDQRFKIVEEHEGGNSSVRQLAEKYACGKTQVSNILKNKEKIREEYERGLPIARKRNRTSQYSDLNDSVWEWFKKKNDQHVPVDGPMIQEFAQKAAEHLGYSDFKASSGWLTRFKERHNLSQHKVCGESADVSEDTVASWKERLGSIISGYDPTDIWNLDETGFLFRALPDKSLSEKAKKCKGGKKSKERLTAALLVSATGERRKPIVIGKYANPRCLKNVNRNDLPCEYFNQAKAWMTSDLLHKILSQLNSFFKSKNRSILLFLDSAGCHPYDLKGRYSNVKLVFFPVNCTSKLQPLDLGVIQNFKVHYKKLLLRHVITLASEENSASDIAKTLYVLQAMNWMATAWSKVEASTISKCFAAGGISADVAEVDDEGDPFNDLDTELQDLIEQAAPSCGINTETLIRSEDELPVCYSICNEQQLLDSISNQSQEIVIEDDGESGSENEESESSSAACPQTSTLKSFAEVVASVQEIQRFLVQHGQVSLASDFSSLGDKVSETAVKRRKHQSTLDDYFKKK